MDLVHQAICAGIFNDLGSGGNVDLCTIDKDGATMHRSYDRPNERKFRNEAGYKFRRGTTTVLSETEELLKSFVEVSEEVDEMEVG